MRHRPFALLASVVLAACAAPPAPPFAVTCIDADGAPVRGANVTFHVDDDGSTLVIAEDAQGIGCATVPAGTHPPAATVRMWPRTIVRGRVQVPEGHAEPVRVSVVHVNRWPSNERTPQGFERTWSPSQHCWLPVMTPVDTTVAADGTFSLPVATDVTTILAFTSPGLAMTQRFSGWSRDVRMFPERRLVVTVVDEARRPIAGTSVRLFEPKRTCGNGAEPWLLEWTLQTAADGTATFDRIPLGHYFAFVRVPGCAAQLHLVDLVDQETAALTLRADPGILVRGVVRDDAGRGVPGIAVVATVDVLFEVSTTRTDADGAYELRVPRHGALLDDRGAIVRLGDLPVGWRDATPWHTIDMTAIAGDTHTLDFVLQRR